MKTVAIVISAIYNPNTLKLKLNKEELLSLEHLKKHLNNYDKYFMVPDRTNINKYTLKKFRSVKLPKKFYFLKFPERYFGSPQKHSQLLLKKEFYSAFKEYRYILLYHTDALVFSDQLLEWCNSGYDYIAAPWFRPIIGPLSYKKGSSAIVGNGGFSLRNVQKSLRILKRVEATSKRSSNNLWIRRFWFLWAVITGKSHKIWLDAPADNYPFNEDGFWSLEAPKYLETYKNAPYKEALKFAFERFPRRCFATNNRQLPFGCHAWHKYDKDFWLPYL
jgi:hypothetical protein